MKIVGVTYYDGCENVVLKSDSSMLVNRKPLFLPEATGDLQALPCWVLRVSRLGRSIAPRFAARYYDAVAPGMDFFAADLLRQAKSRGASWTEAVAFENSLAIGAWQLVKDGSLPIVCSEWSVARGGNRVGQAVSAPLETGQAFADAVARVSDLVTIRQGDLIYIACRQTPWQLQVEDIVRCTSGEEETLYCKIK